MSELDTFRFADWCGFNPDVIPSSVRGWLQSGLSYRTLEHDEIERVVLQLLRASEDDDVPVAGPRRQGDWEQGWGEVESRFRGSGCQLTELEPTYRHGRVGDVLRQSGRLIQPCVPHFHRVVVESILVTLAHQYFSACLRIHEFGCGTGWNLALLAQQFPDQQWWGSDWAHASGSLLETIIAQHRLSVVNGGILDLFVPDPAYSLGRSDGVLTVTALEQVGTNWEPFLGFLLAKHPCVCVHLEPIYERYDPSSLTDYLAVRYHDRRGYLKGYLPVLERLARQGRAEMLHVNRTIGYRYHEGHTIVVWRPT